METTLKTYFSILEGVYEIKFFDWTLRFRVIEVLKQNMTKIDQNLS